MANTRRTVAIAKQLLGLVPDFGQSDDLFIDLGPGHLGSEAWVCREMRPDCRIIGLEPSPSRFDNLAPTYPGELLSRAISDHSGIVAGFIGKPVYPAPLSDFKLVVEDTDNHIRKYNATDMTCSSVDSLVEEFGPVRKVVVWADIEGSELAMLNGATRSLGDGTIVAVNLELLGLRGWYNPAEPKEVLNQSGFSSEAKIGHDFLFIRNAEQGGV